MRYNYNYQEPSLEITIIIGTITNYSYIETTKGLRKIQLLVHLIDSTFQASTS